MDPGSSQRTYAIQGCNFEVDARYQVRVYVWRVACLFAHVSSVCEVSQLSVPILAEVPCWPLDFLICSNLNVVAHASAYKYSKMKIVPYTFA